MSRTNKELIKGIGVNIRIFDKSYFIRLDCDENLSNIRKELEQRNQINMRILLFTTKENAIILKDEEGSMILKDILDKDNNLNLVKEDHPNLRYLIDKCKLEYGRTITSSGTIEIAKEKAFIMREEDCISNKLQAGGCVMGKFEFSSNEDKNIRAELSLTGDIDVQNFVNLGLSIGRSRNTNSKSEISSTCNFTCCNKLSLKFRGCFEPKIYDENLEEIKDSKDLIKSSEDSEQEYFEPTEKFISRIKDAIKSRNPEQFKKITKDFGQFISNDVILGGRIYFEGKENSQKSSEIITNNTAGSVKISNSKIEAKNNCEISSGIMKSSKYEWFKLIGGEQPNSLEEFDEKAWIQSLNDFENWDCTKLENPVSIFQLLPFDLRKKIFKIIGKKILYINPGEDYNYKPTSNIIELKNISPYISDIIKKTYADCSIFATVIDNDDTKNDFFNCQVLWKPNMKPRLIIHRLQNKQNSKKKEYSLKIGLMIIGYDINFNFINSDNSDFDIQFKVLKNEIKVPLSSMDWRELFDNSFAEENPIYLGIPVLKEAKLMKLVIGHHFYNCQESNKIGTYIYSYCLEEKHFVKLPDSGFTFYILIILNNPNYEISPLTNYSRYKSKTPNSTIPKYISMHSTKDKCAPIFLKQKPNDNIKIKYIDIEKEKCKVDSCICKKKLKENDLKFQFFKGLNGYY
ncbi:hypothetical protein C1645_735336 [Glomus cerebriforme]|uniref:MACPF domain-containing protein n=1 Tax=Glomus cerebriforme TaxID=658196 RepID=A0A397T646_9GLOM|nr:hypothetical protein C1645_735336 [Glomus cerebriforme]